MAENINVTPGTGATIAAENLGGALVQRVKPVLGDLDTDGGDISATNPMPITGTGTAGTPATGIMTIQGNASGTPIPISGSITATNLSIGATGAAVPVDATMVGGSDGTNLRAFKVSTTGVVAVDGSAVTQPISASTLPLPTGASTSANQSTIISSLSTIATDITTSQPRKMQDGAGNALASSTTTPTGSEQALIVRNIPSGTQAVSGTITANAGTNLNTSALALESGGHLASIDGKVPSLGQALSSGSVPVVLPATQITALTPPTTVTVTQSAGTNLHVNVDSLPSLPAGSNAIGSVSVSNFPATQPVSGTVTANAGTGTFTVDASGHTVPVSAASLPLPAGASTAAKQPALGVAGTASTDVITVQGITSMVALKVDGSGVTQPVSAASLPLPSGASTSALQTTGNTSLASIDTKTPSLGQALAASSVPVVLTAAQITTLTPPTTVTVTQSSGTSLHVNVDNFPSTQAVTQSGAWTVTANAGTNLNTSALALDTSVNGILVSQASATTGEKGPLVQGAVTSSAPAYTTGQTNPLSLTTTGALRVDGSSVTQPVSGTVTAKLDDGSGNAIGSTGGALNVNVSSGSVTATNASIGSTGAAVPTSATFAGMSVAGNLTGLTGTANGLKVDGSAVTQPVSGTVTANAGSGTFAVSATALPLPTGAATSALQTTGNTSLATIATNIPAQGQALAAASMPVVLPAAQITALTPPTTVTVTQATGTNLHAVIDSGTVTANAGTGTFAVSAASLPLPTGAATSAKQPALGTAGTASTDVITVQGIASMTALKVDGSAVTQPISATALPLPTGASTSALQTTGNTSLATIATNTTGLVQTQASTTAGQSGALVQGAVTTAAPTYTTAQTSPLSLTTAGALRVDASATTQPVSGTVTANAGSGTFAVSASALPLPTGAATSALQTTGNTSLSSIDTKTPALGQALAAASVPVVLTAAQITTLTPPTTVTVTQATGTNLHAVIDSGTVTAAPAPGSITATSVTATNTSATLLASNSSRKYLMIQNNTAQTAWIAFGATAATAAAPSLSIPGGSSYSLEGNFVSTQQINVIRGGASNVTLTVLEGA